MLHATCYMLHATYYMLHATHYILHATWYILHATYMLQATSYMLRTTYCMLHARLYMYIHCTTCCILPTTCYMLHTVCCHTPSSHHSIADDTMEEKRLLTPQSERGRPLGWGGEGEEGDRQSMGEGEASFVQLREMLKTEREQKVHCVCVQ